LRISYKGIKKRIVEDFPEIRFEKSENRTSYMEDGVVYLKEEDYNPKTMVALFNILHEVGHVLTSEPYMGRSEREWRATMWAIFVAKRYGVTIPDWRKENFQKDIYFWFEVEKQLLKTKPRICKTALKLQWR